MSSIPLTLAEAVPLGTVLLQRLLDDAGIRSLVIKGPAFVELGVRKPKHSNDIDLLIHPDDRERVAGLLEASRWQSISHWFPPALDDVIYSVTYAHPSFPASVDVHHYYSGVFARADAFESMWAQRVSVDLAHAQVVTMPSAHALIFEALNKFKAAGVGQWDATARAVVDAAQWRDLEQVRRAAEELGATESAGALIAALGGPRATHTSPKFRRWAKEAGRFRSRIYFWRIVTRSPQSVPRVMWQQINLPEKHARWWAEAHGIRYRSRRQVLWLRLRGLATRRDAQTR
ncbi:nucleotidyltransferase family protein [Janibacter indicus]|uniref:Nucleotidyltransferase family protein n=1 Tax=Janibacter indicus TaxID=857417 RepID=A0A7L9J1Q8_9MICO|nr:nucleotidyltransferase family protein [Janibacter indicus]QOK23566.1 nucleotidyltransferase family protein [Janibacter indicus]